MAFYAIGLMPMLWSLSCPDREEKQVAYADDLSGDGKLLDLKSWLDSILEKGPIYNIIIGFKNFACNRPSTYGSQPFTNVTFIFQLLRSIMIKQKILTKI